MKKKVLILGGTGMLGFSLFSLYLKNNELDVYATVRKTEGLEKWFNSEYKKKLLTGVDAEKFEVVVDNSDDFSSPEFSSADVQETEVKTNALNSGLYYWRVKAQNGDWSEVWIFTIGTHETSAAQLSEPANGTDIELMFYS